MRAVVDKRGCVKLMRWPTYATLRGELSLNYVGLILRLWGALFMD